MDYTYNYTIYMDTTIIFYKLLLSNNEMVTGYVKAVGWRRTAREPRGLAAILTTTMHRAKNC